MKQRLSVAIVSRSNAVGGGASRIAEELAGWLSRSGVYVVHFCGLPKGVLKTFQVPLYPPHLIGKISQATHRTTRRLGFKELIPVEFLATLRSALNQFDVVHFHDLDAAISPLSLYLCLQKKAVVFTAHDCSCFTGGCVYPLGCEAFLKKCGNCPQLASMGTSFDFTTINIRINRWLAMQRGVQYVFPSQWLRETASRSLDFTRTTKLIPNGFLPDGYAFRPKSEARMKLGICGEQKVVLIAAHYLADPRKGMNFALAAIRAMVGIDLLVLFVGIAPTDLEAQLPKVQFWLTGFVSDQQRLGLLLAAADVFLFPSLQDNLPIMVQESLAAGTPVVGFAAGGIPEMVDHGSTGWLCKPGDQLALNENLRNALTCEDLNSFGDVGRRTVRERFDMNVFGNRHLSLYEEVKE